MIQWTVIAWRDRHCWRSLNAPDAEHQLRQIAGAVRVGADQQKS
jgi:hypothetical protein